MTPDDASQGEPRAAVSGAGAPAGSSADPRPPAASDAISPRAWAIVVWSLYLASYITFFLTAVIGLIIALIKRDELAGTEFASHMTSAIRTFWIAFVGILLGAVLSVIGIGVVLIIALVIWHLFRSVRGLVLALDGKPIADPAGWW